MTSTAAGPALRILLVEDSPGDTRLLQEEMADAGFPPANVIHETSLADAVRKHAHSSFDVVLLDLSLPDVRGIETVARMKAARPDLPIVVMTGFDDEAMALQAVQAGAQDYLVKGQFDGTEILRAVRRAMERQRLARGGFPAPARTQPRPPGPDAERFGPAHVAEALPDMFDELVRAYAEIVERGGDPAHVAEGLADLAARLGVLRAGPRDVIELHAAATRRRLIGPTSGLHGAAGDPGEGLVLELMGQLAAFYRRYSLSGPGGPPETGRR